MRRDDHDGSVVPSLPSTSALSLPSFQLAAELSAVKCRAMDVEARLEVLSSELQCESQKREAAERQLQVPAAPTQASGIGDAWN